MTTLSPALGMVFVIDLPLRRDRHDEMAVQLGRVGLGWDSPRVRHVPALRPSEDAGFPSIGAHGCFMSHLSAIEQAVAEGLEAMLILEDDCNFSRSIDSQLDAVNAALAGSDWSIFYGGWHLHGAASPPSRPGVAMVEVPVAQPVWLPIAWPFAAKPCARCRNTCAQSARARSAARTAA